MATSRKDEARLFDSGELELVEKTRIPAIRELSDKELAELLKQLRERRDRARDISHRQRRAIRGKSEGKAGFDQADSGNRQKASALAEALQRLSKERARRTDAG